MKRIGRNGENIFLRQAAKQIVNPRKLDVSMKIDRAKTIAELALRVSDDLNSILIELLEDADDQKTAEYKTLIGSILGEIYFGVLRPVYDLYPDLAPDELKTR